MVNKYGVPILKEQTAFGNVPNTNHISFDHKLEISLVIKTVIIAFEKNDVRLHSKYIKKK